MSTMMHVSGVLKLAVAMAPVVAGPWFRAFGEVITFGHGARHLVGTELSADVVEAAIRAEVQLSVKNGHSLMGGFM